MGAFLFIFVKIFIMQFLKEFWLAKSKDFLYLGSAMLVVYLSMTLSGFNEVKSDINLIRYSAGIMGGYFLIWICSLLYHLK